MSVDGTGKPIVPVNPSTSRRFVVATGEVLSYDPAPYQPDTHGDYRMSQAQLIYSSGQHLITVQSS